MPFKIRTFGKCYTLRKVFELSKWNLSILKDQTELRESLWEQYYELKDFQGAQCDFTTKRRERPEGAEAGLELNSAPLLEK